MRTDVNYKLKNDSSGNQKVCHIELNALGPRSFAKSNEKYFEKAAASHS